MLASVTTAVTGTVEQVFLASQCFSNARVADQRHSDFSGTSPRASGVLFPGRQTRFGDPYAVRLSSRSPSGRSGHSAHASSPVGGNGGGGGPKQKRARIATGEARMVIDFKPNDSEVVEFKNGDHERIRVRPMYHELGFNNSPRIFGRQIVIESLLKALKLLPPKYGFLVWDVYRCRETQGKLFEWMRNEIRKRSPDLSDQENYDEARKYMSVPSKIGDEYCPPHLSGGAIDLTLYDTAIGNEIEMGTPFDDCTERAHSDFFNRPGTVLNDEDNRIREARGLLLSAMESVGFVRYQYEWWHFDIGDIFWSRITGRPAVFGPLFGDIEWPE